MKTMERNSTWWKMRRWFDSKRLLVERDEQRALLVTIAIVVSVLLSGTFMGINALQSVWAQQGYYQELCINGTSVNSTLPEPPILVLPDAKCEKQANKLLLLSHVASGATYAMIPITGLLTDWQGARRVFGVVLILLIIGNLIAVIPTYWTQFVGVTIMSAMGPCMAFNLLVWAQLVPGWTRWIVAIITASFPGGSYVMGLMRLAVLKGPFSISAFMALWLLFSVPSLLLFLYWPRGLGKPYAASHPLLMLAYFDLVKRFMIKVGITLPDDADHTQVVELEEIYASPAATTIVVAAASAPTAAVAAASAHSFSSSSLSSSSSSDTPAAPPTVIVTTISTPISAPISPASAMGLEDEISSDSGDETVVNLDADVKLTITSVSVSELSDAEASPSPILIDSTHESTSSVIPASSSPFLSPKLSPSPPPPTLPSQHSPFVQPSAPIPSPTSSPTIISMDGSVSYQDEEEEPPNIPVELETGLGLAEKQLKDYKWLDQLNSISIILLQGYFLVVCVWLAIVSNVGAYRMTYWANKTGRDAASVARHLAYAKAFLPQVDLINVISVLVAPIAAITMKSVGVAGLSLITHIIASLSAIICLTNQFDVQILNFYLFPVIRGLIYPFAMMFLIQTCGRRHLGLLWALTISGAGPTDFIRTFLIKFWLHRPNAWNVLNGVQLVIIAIGWIWPIYVWVKRHTWEEEHPEPLS